ncbi:MAG: hypothetical protein QME64_10765 [bacterium]|nr:hypothetical protein [bacterium]
MHSKIIGLTLLFIFSCGASQFLAADTLAEWTTINHINITRTHTGVFLWNGYLYIAGGYDIGGNLLTSIERAQIYPNGTLGTWSLLSTHLNYGNSQSRIVALRGYMYSLFIAPSSEYGSINPDGSISPFSPSLSLDSYRSSLVGYQSPSTGEGYASKVVGVNNNFLLFIHANDTSSYICQVPD